jgi:hypothetical protein
MTCVISSLVASIVACASAWVVLRVVRPELAKRARGAIVGAALAIGGALVAILSLGLLSKKKEITSSAIDPIQDLEDTAAKYETEDDFDRFAEDDTLDPPPPPAPLNDELEDFRAGADELLGDN